MTINHPTFQYIVKDFVAVLAGFKYKIDAENFVKNYPLKDQGLKIIDIEESSKKV